jgi:hypothetical protein
VNEAQRERLPSLVPLRGSDDTVTMRHWGPLSAVGRSDDVAVEVEWAEWWRDGEGRGRMADGGGGFKVGQGWARLGAVGQHRPGSGGAGRAVRMSRARERSGERGPVRGREKRERGGQQVGPSREWAPPISERKGEREEYDRWAPCQSN